MKKWCFILMLILLTSPVAQAAESGRIEQGVFGRMGTVFGRGLLNAVGIPFEVSSTLVREVEMHPWWSPITFVPRFATNLTIRITSIATDLAIYPLVAPFTNDLLSVNNAMGLPTYPWQIH